MGISFRMIYDPLVSVKSEFGQNRLAIHADRGQDESTESFRKSTVFEILNENGNYNTSIELIFYNYTNRFLYPNLLHKKIDYSKKIDLL